jgi:hypothetical protein
MHKEKRFTSFIFLEVWEWGASIYLFNGVKSLIMEGITMARKSTREIDHLVRQKARDFLIKTYSNGS